MSLPLPHYFTLPLSYPFFSFSSPSFFLFLPFSFLSIFFLPLISLPFLFLPSLPPIVVMDDNRLLTLPNGERIRLQSHCALICETFDLQYASPATISRCGMVWVDPQVRTKSFLLICMKYESAMMMPSF